jgi:7,8-dihydro-6-hydroxymethylpterin dimethyltransferase
MMESKENCGVCGASLTYAPEPVPMACEYCGQKSDALIYCPNNHFICDSCHKQGALEMARQILHSSVSDNPLELFEKIVAHPSVSMHGPEHHAIVAAVIVAAARNSGCPIPLKAVDGALARGEKVPGGWCGFYGACGAAIGVGVAVSVLTRATPLTGKERSLAIKATASALSGMADGDPRCCKRAGRRAIETATDYLESNLDISLGKSDGITCRHSKRNKECARSRCPYYDETLGPAPGVL